MVAAAQNDAWDQLGELQGHRDHLISTLAAPTAADTSLLQQTLTLNQTLETLSSEQREVLATSLRLDQKKRQGINAYQAVTENCH